MRRRSFLQSAALGSMAFPFGQAASAQPGTPPTVTNQPGRLPFDSYEQEGHRGPRTLLFLDYFPLMRTQELEIKQATAEYVPEGYFVDPELGSREYDVPGSVPYFDEKSGLWRRLEGYPDLFALESEDAIRWRISPDAAASPAGGQKAPHHLYRSPVPGFGSSVFHDPIPPDGNHFKMLVLEFPGPSYRYALDHPDSFWHPHALEAKANGGAKAFHWRKHSMLVSPDGKNWELRRDYDWGTNPMIIEEHFTLYRNYHTGNYTAVHRPRWGDRRLFTSTSPDCERWSPLELMLHPDVLDRGRTEFHGCSVNQYDSYYIALVWYGNYASFDAPAWSGGPDDTHLAYSYDGSNFIRGHRQPLIPLRQSGQPTFRGLWTRGLLQKDEEILIYSDTWEFEPEALAGTVATDYETRTEAVARREAANPSRASVIHRLRKDGFTYLEPTGEWGQCQTMYLNLFDGGITINADASAGELWYEIGEPGRNNVIPGFSYDDCVPMIHADSTTFELRFREKDLAGLHNRPIYVRFKLKRSRLYSMRGDFSFDPTHRYRTEKGMVLHEPSWLF